MLLQSSVHFKGDFRLDNDISYNIVQKKEFV